jgi:hypothetical protein
VKRWAFLLVPVLLIGSSADYLSAKRKFDLIEKDRLSRGTRVELTSAELNAWVEQEVPSVAPQGVRNPRLDLGQQHATGAALIDFGKLQRAQGNDPGWLMSKLLDGERPVRVTTRIRSAGGQATVDVERVEISGVVIDGQALDFLIRNFLLPMYPNAVIGRPFELGNRIERLDVRPGSVGVVIGP